LTGDFFVIRIPDFRGSTWKAWGKIRQSMTEKDLSSGACGGYQTGLL